METVLRIWRRDRSSNAMPLMHAAENLKSVNADPHGDYAARLRRGEICETPNALFVRSDLGWAAERMLAESESDVVDALVG